MTCFQHQSHASLLDPTYGTEADAVPTSDTTDLTVSPVRVAVMRATCERAMERAADATWQLGWHVPSRDVC